MRDLNGQQVRQLVDMKQLYETLLQAESQEAQSFKGSMSWEARPRTRVPVPQALDRMEEHWCPLGRDGTRLRTVPGRAARD